MGFVESDQVLFRGFIRHLSVSYLDVYLDFVYLIVLPHNFWEIFYLPTLDQLILIQLDLSDPVFNIVHLVDLLSLGSVVHHARIFCVLYLALDYGRHRLSLRFDLHVVLVVFLQDEQLFDHLTQVFDSLAEVDFGWVPTKQLNGGDCGSDGHLFGFMVKEDFDHHVFIL